MALNRTIIMGRLTSDPTLRHTNSGKAVASFTLAVDRDFDKNQTDFIEVVTWGKTAEFASKFFSKGRTAVADGRLQIRDWTDKEGNKRKTAEVVADRVYFGDSKTESKPSSSVYYADTEFVPVDDDDSDIPF